MNFPTSFGIVHGVQQCPAEIITAPPMPTQTLMNPASTPFRRRGLLRTAPQSTPQSNIAIGYSIRHSLNFNTKGLSKATSETLACASDYRACNISRRQNPLRSVGPQQDMDLRKNRILPPSTIPVSDQHSIFTFPIRH
jgi:hypothetical protein